MKLLIRLLITFLALSLIYIGLCFIGPNTFSAKNNLSISAPIEMVFDEIINLKNWDQWSPWVGQDTSMAISFGNIEKGIGASYSWNSEKSGSGNLIIDEASYPTSIRSKMEFEGWKGISYSYWDLSIDENRKTHLQWKLETDTPIVFLVRGIMFLNGSQKKLEVGLEQGINRLKIYIENLYASNPDIVQEIEMEARTFVIQRDSIRMDQITNYYSENLGLLATAAISQNINMAGMPCGLYYSWNSATQKTNMAAAVPVEDVFEISSGSFETIEGGKVLIVDHFGPYENLHMAHHALSGFVQVNNLSVRKPIIEEYLNDPSLVNDSSEIHTRVYYYLDK